MMHPAKAAGFPERHPGRTIAIIGLLFAALYGTSLQVFRKPDGRIVVGDAVHYYVYLRSMVFDGDLQFRNDYTQFRIVHGKGKVADWSEVTTSTGHIRNMMSVGPAIVWGPGYLLTCAAVAVMRVFGSTYPLDGFQRAFQASAGFSGILAATLGAWFTFRLSATRFGVRASIWATLVMWIGSSALYYSLVSPTYSHAASMLAVSGFFIFWATTRERQTAGRYASVGALAGLVALVRWQDAVFLIVPAIDAISVGVAAGTVTAWRRSIMNGLVCLAAALVAFSPQVWAWLTLYGQFVAMPQGSNWMQWDSPHLLDVLFSEHGLLSWTPLAAIGVAGLVPLCRRDRVLGVACVAALAVSWYANAAVLEWWAGEAFGARRFVSCFPILTLGLAALLERDRPAMRWLVPVVCVLVCLNLVLLVQYQAFMHGVRSNLPYPKGAFTAPIDLVRWLWTR